MLDSDKFYWAALMRYRVTFTPLNCQNPHAEIESFIAAELDADFFCGPWKRFTWNHYLISIEETADVTRLLLTHSDRVSRVIDMVKQKVVFEQPRVK
jgi:hypothetical protein